METLLQDFIGVIGAMCDAFSCGLIAIYYGFSMVPAGIGFAIGAIFAAIFGLATPISFQPESIILLGNTGKNFKDRLSMLVIAGVILMILGVSGLLNAIVNYIGGAILAGMLAGVGIILVKACLEMLSEDRIPGMIAMVAAIIVYFTTANVMYALFASIVSACIVYNIKRVKNSKIQTGETQAAETEELQQVAEVDSEVPKTYFAKLKSQMAFVKPNLKSPIVWLGAMSFCALQIGANISYGSITADYANQAFDVSKLTFTSGLADSVAALFSGAPMGSIIALTAFAPHPVTVAVIFMAVMAILLIFTNVAKVFSKYVPVAGVAPYAFILGALFVLPDNLKLVIGESGNSIAGIITFAVTSITNPFYGMIAGILCKLFSL